MVMASKPEPLEAGTTAPPFTGTTFDGQMVNLTDYKGIKVALYFYPKDSTPGCTKQACNLRDNIDGLSGSGIAVIGVSPDENASHEKFSTKHDLPFALLADPDHKIIGKYGVWGQKQNYGKTYMGLQRTTFLIDEAGQIMHVFKRPKTSDHATEILSKL
jgi:peroxiredoxin Q/BCP|tara:strand:+ start:31 stop:507 length:477 start_codon:yes stop_codon:yes gene_type:complete